MPAIPRSSRGEHPKSSAGPRPHRDDARVADPERLRVDDAELGNEAAAPLRPAAASDASNPEIDAPRSVVDPLASMLDAAPARKRPGPEGGPATWGCNKGKGYWYVLYRGRQILTNKNKQLIVEASAYHNLYGTLPPRWLAIDELLRRAVAARPYLDRWIAPMLLFCGSARVIDMDPTWCRAFHAWRTGSVSPKTGRPVSDGAARNDLKVVLAIVRGAIPDKNFVIESWLPDENPGRDQWLDADRFDRLVHIALGRLPDPSAEDGWLRSDRSDGRRFLYRDPETRRRWSAVARLAMIAGYTATRRTMTCNSRWVDSGELDGGDRRPRAETSDDDDDDDDADGDWGHFVIEQPPEPSQFFRKGATEPETGKRGGEVPLAPVLRRFLHKARALDRSRGIEAVIHDGLGGKLDVQYAWDQVRRAAGLPDGYTIHCLRRSCIMWLLLDDVPLDEICAYAMVGLENLLEHYAEPDALFTERVAAANDRAAGSLRNLLAKHPRKAAKP